VEVAFRRWSCIFFAVDEAVKQIHVFKSAATNVARRIHVLQFFCGCSCRTNLCLSDVAVEEIHVSQSSLDV
jgi:hypothetical protein